MRRHVSGPQIGRKVYSAGDHKMCHSAECSLPHVMRAHQSCSLADPKMLFPCMPRTSHVVCYFIPIPWYSTLIINHHTSSVCTSIGDDMKRSPHEKRCCCKMNCACVADSCLTQPIPKHPGIRMSGAVCKAVRHHGNYCAMAVSSGTNNVAYVCDAVPDAIICALQALHGTQMTWTWKHRARRRFKTHLSQNNTDAPKFVPVSGVQSPNYPFFLLEKTKSFLFVFYLMFHWNNVSGSKQA